MVQMRLKNIGTVDEYDNSDPTSSSFMRFIQVPAQVNKLPLKLFSRQRHLELFTGYCINVKDCIREDTRKYKAEYK